MGTGKTLTEAIVKAATVETPVTVATVKAGIAETEGMTVITAMVVTVVTVKVATVATGATIA